MASLCDLDSQANTFEILGENWKIIRSLVLKQNIELYLNLNIDDLVQDCSNSIADALELLQSCTKPLMYFTEKTKNHLVCRSVYIRGLNFEHNNHDMIVLIIKCHVYQAQFVENFSTWRENHHYCRTTLSIMSLGWLSAIQCKWLVWWSWDRTGDLSSPCVCSATKMLIIKHPYRWHPFEMTGDCPESNQLHFIIPWEINIYLHNCNLWKMYLKSKLQWCFYVNFYQSYDDL